MSHRAALAVILALGAAPALGRAQNRCEWRAESLSVPQVRIHPVGAPVFTVAVQDVSVAVEPGTSSRSLRVSVRGALTFDGASQLSDLALYVTRPVSLASGMVRLWPGARAIAVTMVGAGVVASVAMDGNTVVRALGVACDALSVVAPSSPSPEPVDRAVTTAWNTTTDLSEWLARDHQLVLRDEPRESALGVWVDIRDLIWTSAYRVARRGDWSRLVLSGEHGRVFGWVEQRSLVRRPPGCGGDTGITGFGSTCMPIGHVSGPGSYSGPAEIEASTEAYEGEGTGRWATVTTRATFEVEHAAGSAWVRVLRVPGIAESESCGGLRHAWVPASSVTFPTP